MGLPRLEKKELVDAFRMFVQFVLVWFCLFLPLDVWKELRFVIVAFPGLFSYPFFFSTLGKKFSRQYFEIFFPENRIWYFNEGLALWAKISADDISKYFIFHRKQILTFMQIFSSGDSLHECQILFSGKKEEKYHQIVICWISLESGKVLIISITRNYHTEMHFINPYPAEHDNPYLCKHCRTWSDGFWRSRLIWIYTVCHVLCELNDYIISSNLISE